METVLKQTGLMQQFKDRIAVGNTGADLNDLLALSAIFNKNTKVMLSIEKRLLGEIDTLRAAMAESVGTLANDWADHQKSIDDMTIKLDDFSSVVEEMGSTINTIDGDVSCVYDDINHLNNLGQIDEEHDFVRESEKEDEEESGDLDELCDCEEGDVYVLQHDPTTQPIGTFLTEPAQSFSFTVTSTDEGMHVKVDQ